MTSGSAVFETLQRMARLSAADGSSTMTIRAVPTGEYLLRHLLESFLDRLTRTEHADKFVLKGGMLLSVYGSRRPTRDIDSAVVDADVTPERLLRVVSDIASIEAADGVEFDVDATTTRQIRDDATYPGLRLRVPARVGPWRGVAAWDVSTGDPIVPPPQVVRLPRIVGGTVTIVGYRPETTIAEKGVTILERGLTSTRWRDYVDIVELFECYEIDPDALLSAARAVAGHRGVELGPIAPRVGGYGALSQERWAAWRRKEHLEHLTAPDLDAQLQVVAQRLDPIFAAGQGGRANGL